MIDKHAPTVVVPSTHGETPPKSTRQPVDMLVAVETFPHKDEEQEKTSAAPKHAETGLMHPALSPRLAQGSAMLAGGWSGVEGELGYVSMFLLSPPRLLNTRTLLE